MTTILIWFDNIPQAQDWQLKLRKEHWTISDIAARQSKKYTIEVKIQDSDSAIVFHALYPELQNNTLHV